MDESKDVIEINKLPRCHELAYNFSPQTLRQTNFTMCFCKADPIEEKLDRAMPWVGLYIAAASAVCTLAIAADAFNGFRRKRLWFPTKYFSPNATILTLLAVAMKLPMDLNTDMFLSTADWFAKYISIIFMSTALANFMSSLGSMTDKEILANTVALGILVITVAGNVLIQLIMLRRDLYLNTYIFMAPTIFLLRLLVKLLSLAIMVPTIKRILEAKYQEQHKVALREEEVSTRRDAFKIDNLRRDMMKYWVMAETSNPQFVMARSVVCTTAICFISAITLVGATVAIVLPTNYTKRNYTKSIKLYSLNLYFNPESVYGRSTIWIQFIQAIGVVVGTIAPTLRWFSVVSSKCSAYGFSKAFTVEAHWTQILVDYRDSSSDLLVRKHTFRKFIHDAKWYIVTFCIGVQVLALQLSKLFVFLSILLTSPFFICFALIKIFVNRDSGSANADHNIDTNLNSYVLLLEGEPKLPTRLLKKMCDEANNTIQLGRKKQPKNLLDLLQKSRNFNGVTQFDSNTVPSLHSEEPPNYWTLPVVILTSIAIALPNTTKHDGEKLLSSVSEGLSLAKIVEKTLCGSAHLVNVRRAADICWAEVLLYTKWLGVNLNKISGKCKNSKEVLQLLSKKAIEIIMEFKKKEKDPIMENPLNWPPKVMAANSMYRISQTILLSYEEESEPADESVCVMVGSILAACLTNLPHVISTMCHRNAIEKRENSVRKAFRLLGKTEQVVELLQQQEWPYQLDHEKAAYIEEWRSLFLQNDDGPESSASISSDENTTSSISNEEHLAITVDSNVS